MRTLRLVLRLTGFLVATLVCAVPVLLGALLRPLAEQPLYRWIQWWSRLWARIIAAIVGMRVTVRGTPPKEPYIMVCNHLGYMDIIALLIPSPGYFVSKADVKNWPLLGPIIRHGNIIFLTRENLKDLTRVSDHMRKVIERGHGLIFFPEGTSSGGTDLLPLKPSLLQVAIDAELPVHVASLHYETAPGEAPATTSVCWWGGMTFFPHFIELLKIKRFHATITFANESCVADNRKALAKDLQQAILAIFTPTGTP